MAEPAPSQAQGPTADVEDAAAVIQRGFRCATARQTAASLKEAKAQRMQHIMQTEVCSGLSLRKRRWGTSTLELLVQSHSRRA